MIIDVQLSKDLFLVQCTYQEENIIGMRFLHDLGAFFAVVKITEGLPDWLGYTVLIIENISLASTVELLKVLEPHKEAIEFYYRAECLRQQHGG